jgi:lipopolysaccharide export LptBFGC system permease protein LptF
MLPFLAMIFAFLMLVLSRQAPDYAGQNMYLILAAIFFATSLICGALNNGRS